MLILAWSLSALECNLIAECKLLGTVSRYFQIYLLVQLLNPSWLFFFSFFSLSSPSHPIFFLFGFLFVVFIFLPFFF